MVTTVNLDCCYARNNVDLEGRMRDRVSYDKVDGSSSSFTEDGRFVREMAHEWASFPRDEYSKRATSWRIIDLSLRGHARATSYAEERATQLHGDVCRPERYSVLWM